MEQMFQVAIPECVENLNLPNPDLLSMYQNYENRVIWLDTEVDDSWLLYAKWIIKWNEEDKGVPEQDRKPIKLFFYSPGGDLDINNMLVDIIKLSKTKIQGVAVGIVCSAACFIYMACHERFALPHAEFLLHSGSAEGISGTAQQIEAYNAQYKKKIKQLKEYLYDYIPKKTVDAKMKGEWFFDSNEAVELGVAHKIINSLDEVI